MKIFNTNKFSETSRILIVTKFILVLLELILTCQSLGSIYQNIGAGMRPIIDANEYTTAEGYTIAFLILCLIFQIIQIGLNMLAMNIHFDKINSVLCIYHFIGLWTIFCYLFDRWRYKSIMYIWVIFCIIPLLFEIFTTVNGYYYYGIREHNINETKRKKELQEYNKKKQEEERNQQQQEEEIQPLNDNNIQNPIGSN